MYPVGIVEFGRYFQDKKLRRDDTKFAIEGKTILDNLIKQGLPIETTTVLLLKICSASMKEGDVQFLFLFYFTVTTCYNNI